MRFNDVQILTILDYTVVRLHSVYFSSRIYRTMVIDDRIDRQMYALATRTDIPVYLYAELRLERNWIFQRMSSRGNRSVAELKKCWSISIRSDKGDGNQKIRQIIGRPSTGNDTSLNRCCCCNRLAITRPGVHRSYSIDWIHLEETRPASTKRKSLHKIHRKKKRDLKK